MEGSAFADIGKQDGVDPTGVTECAAAIQSALDAFAALGVRAYAKGAFRIGSTVTVTGGADLGDATFNHAGSGVAVQVGANAAPLRAVSVTLPRIVKSDKPGTGWVAGTTGVRAVNLYESRLTVPKVSGFETGLLVTANGRGNVYNTYAIGHLENNKRNQVLSPETEGWVNQNTFIAGRYSHLAAEGSAISGARHILTDGGTTTWGPPNNNVWVNASVEGSGAEYALDIDGTYNIWIAPRLEGAGGIRWAANAARNRILGGYGAGAAAVTRVTGSSRNSIEAGDHFELYGGSSNGVLRVQNVTSGTAPALVVLDVAASIADLATGWVWQHTSKHVKGKRRTDAEDRVLVDGENGRVYFGSGSAAPTAYIGYGGGNVLLNAAHLIFGTDNANDIGASATTFRPRTVRVGTSVQFGNAALPTASATYRGEVRMVQGGAGVADRLVVCRKDAADAYAWVDLF